ncbi:MAG: Ldh family oxidoreductase [Acetivibrionales bacterium]
MKLLTDIGRFDWKSLRSFSTELFTRTGMPEEDAFIVADSLVTANLTGVDSHGVSRIPIYIERLQLGVVAKTANYEILREFPATMLVDAKNSMGAVVSARIMELAVKKAKSSGCVSVAVKNSNHFGMASYFAKMALKERLIAFVTTNAPSTMAPYGGIEPYFGTNPIACAMPSRTIPVVMDMATSVVARGKIILAAKNGQSIPEGWAITRTGEPTINAQEALEGTVLPFAGPKGYAIAMMADILSGILAGGPFGTAIGGIYNNPDGIQQVGHFFTVIDPDCFVGKEQFLDSMDEMIRQIKSAPRAKGVEEIFLPGEIEERTRLLREKEGITLTPAVIEDLKRLGKQLNVTFPSAMNQSKAD